MVNILISKIKIIARKRKFTGATMPHILVKKYTVLGKTLKTINISDNTTQKIECSICNCDLRILRNIYQKKKIETTINKILKNALTLTPSFF